MEKTGQDSCIKNKYYVQFFLVGTGKDIYSTKLTIMIGADARPYGTRAFEIICSTLLTTLFTLLM